MRRLMRIVVGAFIAASIVLLFLFVFTRGGILS